jgi:hypothetical protein
LRSASVMSLVVLGGTLTVTAIQLLFVSRETIIPATLEGTVSRHCPANGVSITK